ncbi:MAG: hypothetical protein ACLTSX_00475 [Collinsella sp.]
MQVGDLMAYMNYTMQVIVSLHDHHRWSPIMLPRADISLGARRRKCLADHVERRRSRVVRMTGAAASA